MTLTTLKNRLEFIESNILTKILLFFVVSMLLLFIFTTSPDAPVDAQAPDDLKERELRFISSSSMYPDGIRPVTPTLFPVPTTVSKSQNNTPRPSPTAAVKQKPVEGSIAAYTEDVNSTAAGRDEDRILITQHLADRISEYTFLYSKVPQLYADKSKTPLSSEAASSVYFYNEDENRTNAAGFTLSSESYQLSKVESCESSASTGRVIVFVYTDDSISLCKETSGVEKFWIAH
jgi:hypothetical protein